MAGKRRGVFIFRRDLRLEDNTGLNRALAECDEVVPAFVFDRAQRGHIYFSTSAFQFMLEGLQSLSQQLEEKGGKLYIFTGSPVEILHRLATGPGIQAVYVNRDYTPFAQKRDRLLKDRCEVLGLEFNASSDVLLTEPDQIVTSSGKPYQVFTPFFKNASQHSIPRPVPMAAGALATLDVAGAQSRVAELAMPRALAQRGGRPQALQVLADVSRFAAYEDGRDMPEFDATTRLSAHNKFGSVSIREFFWTIAEGLGKDHSLIRQLYWRDFYTHIAFHYPHIFGRAFHGKYDGVRWDWNERRFSSWCHGRTGFPIVDAGMRQLNATGFIHNRVRMIAASFLVKDLHVDWRRGEQYFANQLVDYDPSVNNGNWQWAASTGCDAQPYFRIFNPWRQQEKFDRDCNYIRRWVPELSDLTAKQIHGLEKRPDYRPEAYPAPMVEHSEEVEIAKNRMRV